MKIKCLIVDDEHLALVLLQSYIEKVPQLELVGKCESAFEAIEMLQNNEIDLMFLDIQMPDLSGLELLRSLKKKPVVILTTAYTEYAIESYELDVLDYLLKPIPFERFFQSVNKAEDYIRMKKGANTPPAVVQAPNPVPPAPAPKEKNYFFVKADYKSVKINYPDILYIEGLREYVCIYLQDKKRVITLESMKHLAELLPSDQFVRIHRSYIVSIQKVDALSGNKLELNDQSLPIGKSYKDKIMQVFK